MNALTLAAALCTVDIVLGGAMYYLIGPEAALFYCATQLLMSYYRTAKRITK